MKHILYKQLISIILSVSLVGTSISSSFARSYSLAVPGEKEFGSSFFDDNRVPNETVTPAVVFDAIVVLSKTDKAVTSSEIAEYLKITDKNIQMKLRNLFFDLRAIKSWGRGNDASYEISFLDAEELKEIQKELHTHFDSMMLKDALNKLNILERKIKSIRKKYKNKEAKPEENKESDNAAKEDFHCFADNGTGKRIEIIAKTGPNAGNLTIFRHCTKITLSSYPGKLVKIKAKRVNKDLITIYVYTVTGNKKVFTGSFIHSYNKKNRAKQIRKVLPIREHYRAWFLEKTDVIPEEPLDMPIQGEHNGAYVFNTKKGQQILIARIPATRDILQEPDGSYRKYVYGRAAIKDGQKVLYVFFKRKDKDISKACDWFRFELPHKFIPSALKNAAEIRNIWIRITPKPGEPNWYKDIVKGKILARERVESQRPVKIHSGYEGSTYIYLWNDIEREKLGKYRTQNRSLGHAIKEKVPIWLYNVPEEPKRLEIVRIKGASSLDNQNHYLARVGRFYYFDETFEVELPKDELIRRSNSYFFGEDGSVPDPIIVYTRAFGKDRAIVIAEIDRQKSKLPVGKHIGREILYNYVQDTFGRRGIELYLLDQFNQPFARIARGWYDDKTNKISWEKMEYHSVDYLSEKEKQDISVRLWCLGFNSAPRFIIDFLKYVQNNIEKYEMMHDEEYSILVQLAKIFKEKEITIERNTEKLILMILTNLSIRDLKERIADLAFNSDINPTYAIPEDWVNIEGLKDREIIEKMDMEKLIQKWLSEEKSLNEVLFQSQKALFAQIIKFTQCNIGNIRQIMAFESVRKIAETLGISYDDSRWIVNGAKDIVGQEIRIPKSGIGMERFTVAVKNAYIDAALEKYQHNQEKTREKLKISIWELNDALNKLGIKPDKELSKYTMWGEATFKRHLDAFRKYRHVLFDYGMEKGSWYFREKFKGREIITLAKMLKPHSSIDTDALTNIAILRIFALLRKKDRPLVVKYVMPFFQYTCVIQDELIKARDAFWDRVDVGDVEDAARVEKKKSRKHFLKHYLKNEASRKSGYMHFSSLQGSEEFLKYADELVGILEKLQSEKLLDREFLNEMREKFDESRANFDIYCQNKSVPLPPDYRDTVNDLLQRFDLLRKGTSRISTAIGTIVLLPLVILAVRYRNEIASWPWKYILPPIVIVTALGIKVFRTFWIKHGGAEKKEKYRESWDALTKKGHQICEYFLKKEISADDISLPKLPKEGGASGSSPEDVLLKVAENYLKDGHYKKVLDCGSGINKAVAYFSLFAYVKGVEIVEKLFKFGSKALDELDEHIDRSRIEVIHGDYFNEDFSKFDLIYIYWPYPYSFLAEEGEQKALQLEDKLLQQMKQDAKFIFVNVGDINPKFFTRLEKLNPPSFREKIKGITVSVYQVPQNRPEINKAVNREVQRSQ